MRHDLWVTELPNAETSEMPVPSASDPRVPRISVFTLFPELIETHARTSVLGRATKDRLLDVAAHDLRSHGVGVHQAVDDAPFGGGAGMVLAPLPIFEAIETRLDAGTAHRPMIALGPKGRRFDQSVARELAALVLSTGGFSLVCGRYEGFDERIHEHLFDDELSIGDFVLGGGEVAAMAVTEAVARLLPGVMGNDTSATEESFSAGLLEYPQYTRPATFRGWEVPAVLRSGDHAKVARWRLAMALAATQERRPELLAARGVSQDEAKALKEFGVVIPGVEWPPDRPKRKKSGSGAPRSSKGGSERGSDGASKGAPERISEDASPDISERVSEASQSD